MGRCYFFYSSSVRDDNLLLLLEELLDLMHQINNAVKAAQFNAQLANQIFRLCQQLKISGECMEQSHRSNQFVVLHIFLYNIGKI